MVISKVFLFGHLATDTLITTVLSITIIIPNFYKYIYVELSVQNRCIIVEKYLYHMT